ncbi:MAG: hypothetical protein ACO1OB_10710 [Archangium sp.]
MRAARLAGLCLLVLFPSVAFAADTMTTKEFCKTIKTRVGAMKKKCDAKRDETQTTIQLMEITLSNDACETQLDNVEISKSKAKACFDSVSWLNNGIETLDSVKACRDAVKGLKKDGEACFFHLQCGAASFCAPVTQVCASVNTAGLKCRDIYDDCGPEFACRSEKCVPRAKDGEACTNFAHCADGLTCRADDRCGAPKKSGEACTMLNECIGICIAGVCKPECGSK